MTEEKELKLVDSITSGTLRDRAISTLIVRKACHGQSILIILNLDFTKSKMVCGQCPPYWLELFDSITYGTLRERAISTLIDRF